MLIQNQTFVKRTINKMSHFASTGISIYFYFLVCMKSKKTKINIYALKVQILSTFFKSLPVQKRQGPFGKLSAGFDY